MLISCLKNVCNSIVLWLYSKMEDTSENAIECVCYVYIDGRLAYGRLLLIGRRSRGWSRDRWPESTATGTGSAEV